MNDPDWNSLPEPSDDGAADHLQGMALPDLALPATDGSQVDLGALPGLTVLYIYSMTARPGVDLPDDWDEIPGARGCTPQSCAFRDHAGDLRDAGAGQIFGLSTQSTEWQVEAVERMHLPFPLLSDQNLDFSDALNLPRFVASDDVLLKRMALVLRGGLIEKLFYPVFPPDKNAADVLAYLRSIAD